MAKGHKKGNSKIRKYHKPLNLNIGMIIFVIIFIYVLICVFLYFRSEQIVRYEVKEGALTANTIYRGVVLREETVVTTDSAGYINYYAREGERVAKGDLVYTVDETGRLSEYLQDLGLGENSLSAKELSEFRSEVVNYIHGYDSTHFDSIYDFKYSLKNTVLKLANGNMLQSISDMSSADGVTNVVDFCNSSGTGIVAYWTDGYEELTPEQVTAAIFDEKSEYEKTQMLDNDLAAVGDVVYKLSTDENWSIVIPIDPEQGAELLEEGYIKVRFLKNQYESWGQVSLLNNSDGAYLQLRFTNSMVTFVSDRFLDIELILEEEKGLKIPNSAIVDKEFFLVPEEFVSLEERDGENGVYRQCYLEDGTVSVEFVAMDFYSYDSESKKYYLDSDILDAGDILHRMDSQETFVVSERATLKGVYNMNKGYADFKEIHILYQNEEYSIVKANTRYGLNVYDYIVLDAAAVHDDQFINE
ncbi:MAG: hypothetical protein NC417_02890 [Candidatus Gastranaerophilales bacterium]|nr:hypothetical protein [Candidatus Gastranaerophilales bacterium]